MSDNVRIDFACNDPDNGIFTSRVCQIQLPDELLHLSANAWTLLSASRCPRLIEGSDWIRLSGKRWPITASKEWYGNWCWNAYWMADQLARQFLCWLHERQLFNVELGGSRLFNLWELSDTAPLIEALEPERADPRLLGRLFGKAMLAEHRE